jgi:hypothetical protein
VTPAVAPRVELMLKTCAWCKAVIQAGRGPASHGICPACRGKHFPKRALWVAGVK